ncbi:copper resistance CopC family protein [Cellulomonas terrae]|nr:copper resistance CopC family protein [Cellulomonas terrae]
MRMPSFMMRCARATVVLLVCGVLGVIGVSSAQAHNVLRSTDPADGSTVPVVPSQVTLTFDAAALALGTQLVITNPVGAVVSTEPAQLLDVNVTQPLSGDLPAGLYTVRWRVTSEDAHPIEGSFTFTAATSATPDSDAPATPSVAEPTTNSSETSVLPPAPVPATSGDVAVSDAQSSRGAIGAGPLLAMGGGLLLVGIISAVLLWRRRPPAPPAE